MIFNSESKNISFKDINKKRILGIVIKKELISRVDISRQLKISRPTSSTYVNELINDGLIREVGKNNSTTTGGRKAILLTFNKKAAFILGVMIGVKSISIAITDLRSEIIKKIKIPTEEWKGPDSVIKKIEVNSIEILRKENISKENIIGIGIGVTGLVDSSKGVVNFSPNLTGWIGIKMREIIEDKMGLPAIIENEARVQTVAEKKFGLAKEFKNFVCIETGIGIGSGIFIDNRLIVGNKGIAGEIGHIITNMAGDRKCHCGDTGCLETLCSTRSLLDNVKKDIRKSEKKTKYDGEKLKVSDLYKLYEEDDEIVTRNVERNAEYLGIGISNAIKMFYPEAIIIHGELTKFGNKYLNKVKESIIKTTFPKIKDDYNVQFSKLGDDVGLIGVTSIVFNNIFQLDSTDLMDNYIIKNI